MNNLKLQLTLEEEKLLKEYQLFFGKLGINIKKEGYDLNLKTLHHSDKR